MFDPKSTRTSEQVHKIQKKMVKHRQKNLNILKKSRLTKTKKSKNSYYNEIYIKKNWEEEYSGEMKKSDSSLLSQKMNESRLYFISFSVYQSIQMRPFPVL